VAHRVPTDVVTMVNHVNSPEQRRLRPLHLATQIGTPKGIKSVANLALIAGDDKQGR
jgi:hypothetical protein